MNIYTLERKDLIHVAGLIDVVVASFVGQPGYYTLVSVDEDGTPVGVLQAYVGTEKEFGIVGKITYIFVAPTDSVETLSSPIDRAQGFFHVFSAWSLLHDKANTLRYLEKYFAGGHRLISDIRTHYRMQWLNDDADYQVLLDKWEAIRQDEVRTLHELLSDEESTDELTELPFTMDGGVCKVKCVINGLPLYFVFDTGASDVSISSVEANFMLKNGYLTDADFLGKQNYITATGEIHEGTIINLREVRIGDIVLKDVKASVVKSQAAPLLLGQSVFRRFGTLEVDNKASVIRFHKN